MTPRNQRKQSEKMQAICIALLVFTAFAVVGTLDYQEVSVKAQYANR
jgi:hypothetical protein